MNQSQQINILPEDLIIVKSILKKWVPDYEVWAFGSRVTGKARQYSDLDLAIITEKPLNFDHYAEIKNAFSESNLSYKVDIVDWSRTDKNFQEIIKQAFVKIDK